MAEMMPEIYLECYGGLCGLVVWLGERLHVEKLHRLLEDAELRDCIWRIISALLLMYT